jgi:branched-chain amino acid transport system ATP-binding protein
MNAIAGLRRKLEMDTGGVAVFGLVVLALLYFFDEFDTAAFGVLAPNIEKSFHLTDQKFVGLVTINVSLVILFAIPVGYLSDRVRRTPLVVASGILAGVFSFATGIVGTVWLLTLVRFGNGLGLLANGPVHRSLLSDYYPPETRGPVFGDHINAMQVGAIIGPVIAGSTASVLGWRAAFMILIVPILITTAVAAVKLKEPVRGGTDDPEAATEVAGDDPVAFREGARTLWRINTLRRQYYGQTFLGAGLLPLFGYLPLYFQRTFGVSAFGRGLIGGLDAFATLVAVRKAGSWTPGWFAKGMDLPMKRSAIALGGTGVGLALLAMSPALPVAIVMSVVTFAGIGLLQPPLYAVQSLASPARVRSLSFSFGSMFLVAGVAGFFITGLGSVSDNYGIRWGILVLAPFWLIAAAILYSSSRTVGDDVASALRSLNTAVELRRQRLSAGTRSLLLCAGVDVAYDTVQVLFGVDLDVKDGEIIALLGTNGAGKSTLLKAISGLVDPSGGAVFFDGHDVTHADCRRACQLGIVQMPGGRSIFPTLTVKECLRLAGWMYKRHDPEYVRRATGTVLEYFPVLRERGDQLAGNLSGGEQQMLGLGMAFIAKPRLLMIDELTLGLAPTIVGRLIDIVRAIHEQGATIILVEQSVNVALTLAQRAVFMEKGEVRFSGPTAELLERDDILRSVFLEGAASHPEAGNGAKAGRPGDPVATNGAARLSPLRLAEAPVLLTLDGVAKRFGGIKAVDKVSFELREGEILGLIGPNGAGKTTVFDLISGFLVPDAGQITFRGKDVTAWSPDRRARAGLGRSFQDARLFGSLSVAENIAVALERHLEVRDPLAEALGLPDVAESEIEVAWTVHELIELLGLDAYRNKFVSELSTGSRRIVDLAMAIAHEPSVLILDEPSSGIAQRETEALGPLLLRIQREVGCSLLVIEHDMPLVTGIADRIAALEYGHVVTVGPPAEVVNHPEVVASYLGTDAAAINRSGAAALVGTGDGDRKRVTRQ